MRPAHRIRITYTLLGALALSGCLENDSDSGDDTSTGRVNYNGFNGLTYQTASQAGTTNADGQFRYYPGETLVFQVGDLQLASDVPAQQYVTLLEFFEATRTSLQSAMVDDEGLSTHTLTEQQVLQNTTLMNLSRFLMLLNWNQNVAEGEGIDIRDRVITQLNAALPNLTAEIDFNVTEAEFTATDPMSPANQLLAAICFYPEDDELCNEAPTQEEINNAPPRPDNDEDRDPDIEYSEDLQAKKDRIENAVRTMEDIDADDARNYLSRELKAISTTVANRYFLDDYEASHLSTDTDLHQVTIRKIGGSPSITELEAISTRPHDVQINSTDWQSGEVEYFVAGPTGGESELLLTFRPEHTYRWVRKQLRVIIR